MGGRPRAGRHLDPAERVPGPGRASSPVDQPIVAICRSGARSRTVAEALLGAGYDVVNVDGGMRAWVGDDLPIVAADGLPGTII